MLDRSDLYPADSGTTFDQPVWVQKSKVEQRCLKQHNNEASAKTARSTVTSLYILPIQILHALTAWP